MNNIDFKNFEKRKRTQFINCLSGFKPTNLIGTIDKDGKTNLAIISSVFHLGADPALCAMIIRPDTVPRHTLENIRQTHICTVNHVHTDIIEHAHNTSARYPKEISEFGPTQLTQEYLDGFLSPFVKESHIKMSAKLVEEKKIEMNGTHMLILEIQNVYMDHSFIEEDGFINIEKAASVCISGLDSYHSTKILKRLPYAKPRES